MSHDLTRQLLTAELDARILENDNRLASLESAKRRVAELEDVIKRYSHEIDELKATLDDLGGPPKDPLAGPTQ